LIEHLVINEVDLNKHKATLGPTLAFDGQTEQFTGPLADEANALLKNDCRSGWEVPEIV
jgi:hypothetical protein